MAPWVSGSATVQTGSDGLVSDLLGAGPGEGQVLGVAADLLAGESAVDLDGVRPGDEVGGPAGHRLGDDESGGGEVVGDRGHRGGGGVRVEYRG